MRVIALLCGLVATTMIAFETNASAQVDPGGEVSRQQYDAWMSELSNWGRWGADDQLGALNLITPAKRLAAARLGEEGRTVSMARAMTIQTARGRQL